MFSSYHVEQVINEMTGGGADYCFECVGLVSSMEQAYACCRKVSLPKCHFIYVNVLVFLLASEDLLHAGVKTVCLFTWLCMMGNLVICKSLCNSGMGKDSHLRSGKTRVTDLPSVCGCRSQWENPHRSLVWWSQS